MPESVTGEILHLLGDGGPNVNWPDEWGAVYLSGPVTGLPDLNVADFAEAKRLLMAKGYQMVINPLEHTSSSDKLNERERGSEAWEFYMRIAVEEMLKCHTIVLLPGWETSRGAMAELNLAISLKMAVFLIFPSQKFMVATAKSLPSRH